MSTLEDQLEAAISYIESGDYETGIEKTKALLKLGDDELSYEIAQLYMDWGLAEEAYSLLKNLIQHHPGHSGMRLTLAEASIDLDLEDEAIEALQAIHLLDENYLSAQVLLADLYFSQGLEEVAEQRLLEARKQAPNEPILTFALAEFYASVGQVSEAIDLYKDVLHVKVLEHENIPLKLAEMLSLRGLFEEAMIYYHKGLEKGESLNGRFGYAVTAMQAGKPQTAIQQLEKLKEMDPAFSSLYPVLADAYEEEGALEEAIATLKEGISVDEHNERLYLKLAKVQVKAGQTEPAITTLNDLLALDNEHLEGMKLLVELYRETGDSTEIISLYEENELSYDPELTWYYAFALKEEEDVEKAFKTYQDIYFHFSEDPDFLKEYGELAWELGKKEDAIQALEKALRLGPDFELENFLERLKSDL
ncbi:MAG TPA: tetratricopeptide repeat protein [Sporolactobacillaceae bacterium]|nr:tetratricopeptide repeat protein [Sporolactobacillaceae bacterium]